MPDSCHPVAMLPVLTVCYAMQVQAVDASVDQSQAAKAMLKNAKKWERALEKREKEVALQKSIVEQLKLFLAEGKPGLDRLCHSDCHDCFGHQESCC